MFGVGFRRTVRLFVALAVLAVLGGCGTTADGAAGGAGSGGSAGSTAGSESAGGSSANSGGASESSGGATLTSGGAAASTGGSITFAGSSSTGGAQARPPSECLNPVPYAHDGGVVECADRSYRRAEAVDCVSVVPREERVEYRFAEDCWYDSDCTTGLYGHCEYGTCFYGCTTDSECGSDAFCLCGDPVGRCTPARCKSNADCPPDYPCWSPDPLRGFDCQNPTDQCRTNLDCGPRSTCYSGMCQNAPG